MRNTDTTKATEARKRAVALIKEGRTITVFRSIKEAGDALGIRPQHICRNCRGELRTAGGREFKYLEK